MAALMIILILVGFFVGVKVGKKLAWYTAADAVGKRLLDR
jgi:hypothetical protein